MAKRRWIVIRYLDRYKRKMQVSGGSLRNEHIRNSRKLLDETFRNDASLTTGIYMWGLGISSYEECEPIAIRLYKRTFSTANGNSMKFQTLIDTPIITGDIIYHSVSDSYWICTESFNIDNIHYQGKLYECNWIIKWQDKTGRILTYPCQDQNSTQYNSGETANKQFAIGSAQHMITLPCDENTVLIRSPQRFYLDASKVNPTSFIVTQNDTTSYKFGKKGLVKVTLTECVKNNETDRPDLGICDYIEPEKLRDDNSDGVLNRKSVISYTSPVIKSGGDTQVFTGKFYDDEGNEQTSIISKWDIVCDFKEQLKIKEFGNQIAIGIDNDDYIDESIKLVLSDSNGNYVSSLVVQIRSLL